MWFLKLQTLFFCKIFPQDIYYNMTSYIITIYTHALEYTHRPCMSLQKDLEGTMVQH